jgi:hypothetical protein
MIIPHVVQNQEQTIVLSIVLTDDLVFLNNLHVFDVVDLNYFPKHSTMNMDEIIHDDHKHLKHITLLFNFISKKIF